MKRSNHKYLALLASICLFVTSSLLADVKVADCFSNNMVLQRDRPVRVYGTASPGEVVVVRFQEQSVTATADAEGSWCVTLKPLKVLEKGAAAELTIQGDNLLKFTNVLVGDVWLGSGQSNMQYTGGSPDFAEDKVLAERLAAGPYPAIRILDSANGQGWQLSTPANLKAFSALMFSFGYRVQPEIGVPVGLMVGARGGSPSRHWLTEPMLKNEDFAGLIETFKAENPPESLQKKYDNLLMNWEKVCAKAREEGRTRLPPRPEKRDPGDLTGLQVGSLFEKHLRQWVGYTFRGILWDQGESGTGIDEISQYDLMKALIAGWRREFDNGEIPFIYMQKPSGSGCAFDVDNPVTQFARPFEDLSGLEHPYGRSHNHKGEVLLEYLAIMDNPNTWMVTTSDLGPGGHPVCKSGYGWRAGDVALNRVYGRKVPWIGPTYAEHAVEGDAIRVRFDNVGSGLVFRHGEKLQGFAMSDRSRPAVFYWADARIEGKDTVVVTCPSVQTPAHVHYAWFPIHPWANLFSREGLPALIMQTER